MFHLNPNVKLSLQGEFQMRALPSTFGSRGHVIFSLPRVLAFGTRIWNLFGLPPPLQLNGAVLGERVLLGSSDHVLFGLPPPLRFIQRPLVAAGGAGAQHGAFAHPGAGIVVQALPPMQRPTVLVRERRAREHGLG